MRSPLKMLLVSLLMTGTASAESKREEFRQETKRACAEYRATVVTPDYKPIKPWTPDGIDASRVTDAEPIKRRPPRYPNAAASANIPLTCIFIRFDVSETGKVENEEVIFKRPSNAPYALDRAALKSVSKWTYKPATIDGVHTRRTGVVTEVTLELF